MVQIDRTSREAISRGVLEAARRGDREAWTAIYHDLIGSVTGYLARGGVDEPEDVAAEVFLQVARDFHSFKGTSSAFRSWVFVIVHRRMIDWRRSRGRRAEVSGEFWPDMPGGDVEDEAIENLEEAIVADVLDKLTTAQRDVLLLRVVADLSLEETARVMGKRPGAIKTLQHRAVGAVRRLIEEGEVAL